MTNANHYAGGQGSDRTYPLTDWKVRLASDASGPPARRRTKVIGRISELSKKCAASGFTPTVRIRKVDVRTPRK